MGVKKNKDISTEIIPSFYCICNLFLFEALAIFVDG
jgi:hypothetical protein